MQQASLNLVLNCDPEVLWTVLGDMVRNPSRYEDDISLKKLDAVGGQIVKRRVERSGHILEETIELHIDALMVELTTTEPELTLIHQIVPSGKVTLLNLAANWPDPSGEKGSGLDLPERTTQTIQARLKALGGRLKTAAERLSK
jgi:hypothetical protein